MSEPNNNPTPNPQPEPAPQPPAPTDWRKSLPQELAAEKTLEKFTDIAALAKSYVELEKNKAATLPLPNDKWSEVDWANFYEKVGRPAKPEQYVFTEKIPDTLASDEELEKWFRESAYKTGLTPKQANELRSAFISIQLQRAEAAQKEFEKTQQNTEAEINKLKMELGPEFESAISAARAVVKEFGGEEFSEYLRESGLGNDTKLTRFLIKVGRALADDKVLLTGTGNTVNTPHGALAEINRLKGDKDFAKSLMDASHPAHKENKQRWEMLHKLAYPA